MKVKKIFRIPRLHAVMLCTYLMACRSALGDNLPTWRFDSVTLTNGGPPATVQRAWMPGRLARHPVILLLGSLGTNALPDWSTNLVQGGYMLAAFSVAHPLDPDPARRAQWLVFDERFAHSYVLGGVRTPGDAGRVIDYLVALPEVDADKIGWFGSSTTGIFGLAAAVHEPRIKAIVAFVATGAYERWLSTWQPNGLWRGGTNGLWPETVALLPRADPIHSVSNLFPTAVLMISGAVDKVVDPASAQTFIEAAQPYYTRDPERLRFVRYEGRGHNLPRDILQLYAEHWFRLYLHPTRQPPAPNPSTPTLTESARRTAVSATPHETVIGATPAPSGKVPR